DGIRDFHVTGVQTCALPISMARLLIALSVAVLALPLLQPRSTAAQEAVTLKYAPPLEVGATYEMEAEVKTDQILTLAGMPLETHGDTFRTMTEKVVGRSSTGGWTFEGAFSLVQSDLELPGGLKVSFNSNNPDQASAQGQLEMIVEALKATAGAKW